jgi:hypothetical protein
VAHGLIDGRARYIVSNLGKSRLLQEGRASPRTLVGNLRMAVRKNDFTVWACDHYPVDDWLGPASALEAFSTTGAVPVTAPSTCRKAPQLRESGWTTNERLKRHSWLVLLR